jgi:UDP-N-acetylglucosamine 2-epimerase (non-hydrolysing)
MRSGEIAVVYGTRPEVVKLAPVLWELGPAAMTVHTGQHPLSSLEPLLADLGLRRPSRSTTVSAGPRGRQIGEAVIALTEMLQAEAPSVIVVQGDTNSTLAGALAATTLGLPLVHVEAGLRSFDRRMPEEHNRVVTDHLADLLCAPTEIARTNLVREGLAPDRIVVTGNTVVDACRRVLPGPDARRTLLDARGVVAGAFVLATFHRPENVDDPDRLALIVNELADLPVPVLFPAHPRTVDRARRAGLELGRGAIVLVDPLGYRDFLTVLADCALAISDSGGVQEEASVVGRPVVVVRASTERPEVIGTFATLVDAGPAIGTTARALLAERGAVHERLRGTATPYGQGDAGPRIAAALHHLLDARAAEDVPGDRRYDAKRGRHDDPTR